MMGWGVPEQGWRKGPWTPEEDKLLSEYVKLHGEGRWSSVSRHAGLNRSSKSCRLRWVNYLRPGLKRGQITPIEEGIIIELHALWGNKWSTIASYLPGRTDNEIKNYWRTHFKKKEKSSQKQERRKAPITKQKKQEQGQQKEQEDPDMTRAKKTDEKMHEEAPGKQEMIFMHPTFEDQCLPMVSQDVASWADSVIEDINGLWGSLWNLDEPQGHVNHTSNCNKIAVQNQATGLAFEGGSNSVYDGGYILEECGYLW